MKAKAKVLPLALKAQRYDLAAHVLVYGMLKAKAAQKDRINGKKRTTRRKPERP
ncbi:MAG: hypothetical protein ACLFVD_02740 [Dehalococcoidia bacterium]